MPSHIELIVVYTFSPALFYPLINFVSGNQEKLLSQPAEKFTHQTLSFSTSCGCNISVNFWQSTVIHKIRSAKSSAGRTAVVPK